MDEKEEMYSEFGKGFTYCIGLFLMHAEREIPKTIPDDLWFNGAADHVYDLEIPDNLTEEFKDKIINWQRSCLSWRMKPYTKKDKEWAIDTAKEILRQWDEMCGISCCKGEWE